MQEPVAAMLDGGERLHLQHGPIDLIIGADGVASRARVIAFEAAAKRFKTVLSELVSELPNLRRPLTPEAAFYGHVASRMRLAALPFAQAEWLTPMIAVAGAVADEVLDAMTTAAPLTRAYVNNGGDIAFYLAEGAEFSIALKSDVGADFGRAAITGTNRAAGIASSGTKGRSFSFGIADSVTVIASSAASADTAATLIANAVDLPFDRRIRREAACLLQPDSDLGERLVVTNVPPLDNEDCLAALNSGAARAATMLSNRQIDGAVLFLQGQSLVVGSHFELLALERESANV